MIELWWWVEPLFMTGLIMSFIAGIIFYFTLESDTDVWFWIVVILFLPLFVSIGATIVWGISWVFWFIWTPYL